MKKYTTIWTGVIFLFLFPFSLTAQDPPAYAVENVTIHLADGSVIQSGTIVWREGVIESVGANPSIPYDAFTISGGDSLHVYPGFIDGLGYWGTPDLPDPEQVSDPGNPGYERAGIEAQRSPEDLELDGDEITEIMKLGVTTAAIGLKGYMLPGSADLFFLNGDHTADHLFRSSVGMEFALEGAAGGWGNRAYPSTTMGVMARFRQLMYDAEALKDHIEYFASSEGSMTAPKRNRILEAMFPVMENEIPLFLKVDSPEDIDRMLVLKDEFDYDVVIVSAKNAAYKAEELKERGIPVLVSIDLPEKPGWMEDEDSDPSGEEEELYRQRQAEAYRNAAHNIRNLLDHDILVGFASTGLSAKDFHEKILALKEDGDLSEEEIIQILTVNTASVLGAGSRIGELRSGNIANFTLFNSSYFGEEPEAKMVISNGVIHEL
ncbi:MAG: amidohydrolase family protein [Balneolaceae bacterium]